MESMRKYNEYMTVYKDQVQPDLLANSPIEATELEDPTAEANPEVTSEVETEDAQIT